MKILVYYVKKSSKLFGRIHWVSSHLNFDSVLIYILQIILLWPTILLAGSRKLSQTKFVDCGSIPREFSHSKQALLHNNLCYFNSCGFIQNVLFVEIIKSRGHCLLVCQYISMIWGTSYNVVQWYLLQRTALHELSTKESGSMEQ